MDRRTALRTYLAAIRFALDFYPHGYVGAGDDRNRWMSPLEGVIVELEAALEAEAAKP